MKRTVIHAHHSISPIAGDTKRVININADVAGILSDKIVEVEFIPLRSIINVIKSGKFKLTSKVEKKYYVPNISHFGILNDIWIFIFLSYVFFIYKPEFYIEEWGFPRFINRVVSLFRKKTKLILDIHGASPEEFEYLHGFKNNRLEDLERRSVSTAESIICQSDEMKRHLTRKYGTNPDSILVFRCGVDTNTFKYSEENRIAIRHELRIEDNVLLFVYSGGMDKWQRVGDTLSFFKRYHNHNMNSKLLILTRNIEDLNQIVKENKLEGIKSSIITKSLPYKDVPKYLNASDFAFLLRDNVIMNAVASPTKLGEYMACGLPVISTEVAWNWVPESGMNYVVDYESDAVNEIDNFYNKFKREEISGFAKDNLSLEIDREKAKHYFVKKVKL